jgi:hypothetical protein
MAGVLGSLAMLLEPTTCGTVVDLEALPRPDGVPLVAWTCAFPTFGFLLSAPPSDEEAIRSQFHRRGLECERIGTVDDTGLLKVRLVNEESELLDLNTQSVTGLRVEGNTPAKP